MQPRNAVLTQWGAAEKFFTPDDILTEQVKRCDEIDCGAYSRQLRAGPLVGGCQVWTPCTLLPADALQPAFEPLLWHKVACEPVMCSLHDRLQLCSTQPRRRGRLACPLCACH